MELTWETKEVELNQGEIGSNHLMTFSDGIEIYFRCEKKMSISYLNDRALRFYNEYKSKLEKNGEESTPIKNL